MIEFKRGWLYKRHNHVVMYLAGNDEGAYFSIYGNIDNGEYIYIPKTEYYNLSIIRNYAKPNEKDDI